MILVDTSVLIDFLKGKSNSSASRFKSMLEREVPFGITSIIFQELLQGAKDDKEYSLLKKYLETQTFLRPQDKIKSFALAAKIYVNCRKKRITVRSTIDCLIAQIAIENDIYLMHNDKDFNNIAKVTKLRIY